MTSDDKSAATQRPDLEALRAAVSAIEQAPTSPKEGAQQVPSPVDAKAADADADPDAVARAIVLRQLTGSPKSRKQLEDALRRKACPEDSAVRVLDRFEELGLVDDTAYAQTFVRSKQAGRGLARRALAHELRAKGIDDEIAQDVLSEVDPEQERARAHELVAKKLRTMHGLDRAKQTRRLSGMLARKGYDAEVSRVVVNEALDAAAEHARD